MKVNDFTIIIPCILYKDAKKTIKIIRKYYPSIKIIVSLNEKLKKKPKDNNIKLIYSKFKSIGKKRNIAVDASKTKYLAFIDSDAYPERNWIESSFQYLKYKKINLISGPHVDPPNQNFFKLIIGLVKKSFLITMSPNYQKESFKKAGFVKFMPSANWILSKKLFNSMKQMDDKMLRNEDWDFVYKMKLKKMRVFYNPKMLVYHDNSTIKHFIKKRFIYGFYMWPILLKFNTQNFYFYAPLLFTFFLISFPLTFLFNNYEYFYKLIFSFYFFIVMIESIRVSKKAIDLFFVLPILLAGSISPGFGIFFGFFNFIKEKFNKL